MIMPSGSLLGAGAASNKLNIALIGSHGRATAHYRMMRQENVVAICDINDKNMALAAKEFPKATQYNDWRILLDKEKGLDAVVIATTDHMHAFVATWAMNRGLHVYCEKPLGNTVEEARTVRATYLKNKDKLATQHGTQRHAGANFNRVREMVKDGAIGELMSVYAWGNRQLRRPGYLPLNGTPPSHIHYDLWTGGSPMHPFNPDYFSGRPGANCLQWNMYWDFGSGQVGDMGSHTIDLAWNAIDGGAPLSAKATGEPFNPEVTPVEMQATFQLPANDWRPSIPLTWYQGGAMPKSPMGCIDLNKIGHGAMFKGTKGFLVSDFGNRIFIPYGRDTNLQYYNRRKEPIPDLGDFQGQWAKACKTDLKTSCNFDYAGTAVEMMALGLVAYQTGGDLKYDSEKGRVTNNPKADALLSRKYRDGWVLNG